MRRLSQREYRPHGETEALAALDFIDEGLNMYILGPSDSGKPYLAKAIGTAACNTLCTLRKPVGRVGGTHAYRLREIPEEGEELCGAALLILDDLLLHTLTNEREVRVLFEILERRCEGQQPKSTVICSQRDQGSWTSIIMNDETSANAILKRATKNYTVVIKPQAAD